MSFHNSRIAMNYHIWVTAKYKAALFCWHHFWTPFTRVFLLYTQTCFLFPYTFKVKGRVSGAKALLDLSKTKKSCRNLLLHCLLYVLQLFRNEMSSKQRGSICRETGRHESGNILLMLLAVCIMPVVVKCLVSGAKRFMLYCIYQPIVLTKAKWSKNTLAEATMTI